MIIIIIITLSWQIYSALYIYTIKVVSRLNKVNYPIKNGQKIK